MLMYTQCWVISVDRKIKIQSWQGQIVCMIQQNRAFGVTSTLWALDQQSTIQTKHCVMCQLPLLQHCDLGGSGFCSFDTFKLHIFRFPVTPAHTYKTQYYTAFCYWLLQLTAQVSIHVCFLQSVLQLDKNLSTVLLVWLCCSFLYLRARLLKCFSRFKIVQCTLTNAYTVNHLNINDVGFPDKPI